jgi:HAD superfamily hydrolase (TIGR01509 family)
MKAIVFDLDGLMVDSEPLARRAWELVLKDYDRQLNEDLYQKMIGLRLEESSRLVGQSLNIEVDPADLARKETARFELIMTEGLPTMPGLNVLMSSIGVHNIPWAVATSSRLSYARKVLEGIGLLDQCQAIASGEEVKRGKPHPDVYLLASSRLGIRPEECLALEDSLPGCQSARAAGMVTVAVPVNYNNNADFACAEYIYPSLHDVARDLEKMMADPGVKGKGNWSFSSSIDSGSNLQEG